MNTNVIFKTIGFLGFVGGAGAIAYAVYKRNEKTKYQEATAEALVLTDMAKDIAKENFSGANGATARVKSYLCTDGKRKWFSRTPCTVNQDGSTFRDTKVPCRSGDYNEGTWHTNGGSKVCVAKSIS